MRAGFGTNNVDHCTRLCHASSVAALLEGIGSGAVSNQVEDVQHAEVFLVIGSNPTTNHPVAATFHEKRDPPGQETDPAAIHAQDGYRALTRPIILQFNPSTDVSLLNSMLHTIIDEGLCDENFIARTHQSISRRSRPMWPTYSPEKDGVGHGHSDAETATRPWRGSSPRRRRSMIFWGMGISQHIHGTDNSRCLIALSMITGQIGRPGTGLHPLRGQNNVQGASDAGLIPMVFPGLPARRQPRSACLVFRATGRPTLDDKPGLTVVEIMHAVLEGQDSAVCISWAKTRRCPIPT